MQRSRQESGEIPILHVLVLGGLLLMVGYMAYEANRPLDGTPSFDVTPETLSVAGLRKPATRWALPWARKTCHVHDIRMDKVTYLNCSTSDMTELERSRNPRTRRGGERDPHGGLLDHLDQRSQLQDALRRVLPSEFPYAVDSIEELYLLPMELRVINEEKVPARYEMWHCAACRQALDAWLSVNPEFLREFPLSTP